MRFTYIATVLAVVAKLSGASPTVDPHFFPLDEVNMTFASVPNHSELYRRGDLTPGDTLRCGAWEYDTNGVYAEDAIKEVKKKKGQPKPTPPRTCYWVYCDDNHAKIAWCNESYKDTKAIPSFENIADAAKTIYKVCGDGKKHLVSGALGHVDGWFATLSRGECYT